MTSTGSPNRPRFGAYYEGFLGGFAFRWLDWTKVRLLASVLRERPERRFVLDIGCGSGGVGAALARSIPKLLVVGVDHERSLVARAVEKGVAGLLADFERPLPFLDRRFDLVVMVDTIEHVENPKSAIQQVFRLLTPTGAFVVFTPPYDSVSWVIAEKMHGLITRRPADHISPFTRESLSYLLARGFEEWRIGTLNLGLTMYGIARRPRSLA